MHSDHEATPEVLAHNTGYATETHLPGRWATAIHIIWATLVICTLVLFFISLPVYFVQLQVLCKTASCAPGQLSLSAAQSLHNLGLSLKDYATLSLLLGMIWSFVWFLVGGILAWRKYNSWMALITALMLVMQGSESTLSTMAKSNSLWQLPALLVGLLAYLLLTLVVVIFPNGRFVPRWSYWLVILYILVAVQYDFFPDVTIAWIVLLGNLLFVGLLITLLVIQVYRYWRVSNLVERQQTKWILFCNILLFVMGIVISFIPALSSPGSFYTLLFGTNYNIPFLLIPLSFGIAILRYRLYDIDNIINRTLVYGSLTALLALLYFGLIFTLQPLLQGFLKTDNGVVIVVSTLAVVVVFQPLRKGLQTFIDRRFYREKYNTTKILARFSASLREEVDLIQLHEHLVAVVEESMQPVHVSLWLRPPPQNRKQQFINHSPEPERQ